VELQTTKSEIFNMKKNLVFSEIKGRRLHLDLFSPSGNKHILPLVVLIHGGGWSSGNKDMEHYTASSLCKKGYITAAVEYRLSPEAHYPAALDDILASVKWLRQHSSEFLIDTNKIIIMGESAGGQLSALVGTRYPELFYAIINIDGVMDMTTPSESAKDTVPNKPSSGKKWFGFSYKENPELWKEASALNHISKNTPPMLFINSSVPRFHAGRDESINKLNEYGIYSEVHTIKNSPHSFWYFHPWADETLQIVEHFLHSLR
jgi:acetyl esterase/lipase